MSDDKTIKSFDRTPWQEDEIEFVSGNWSIKRSHIDGLYDYTVDDIEASVPVDAFQLIEWGMAKLKTYDALLPWDDGELVFERGAELMRDLTDTDAQKSNRKYIVCDNGKYYKCNKYYLLRHGFAKPTAEFSDKLNKNKPKLKKNDVILWKSDKLVITPRDGVTVEKGAREGMYRITRSGVTFNWNSSRVKDEGLGVDIYEYKLKSLEEYKAMSWSEYREALHGFWMNEHPEEITSVRDVAVIWDGMENDPDDPNLKRIIEFNSDISKYILAQRIRANLIIVNTVWLGDARSEYESIVEKVKALATQISQKFDVRITLFTDLGEYEELKNSFFTQLTELEKWKNEIQSRVVQVNGEYNSVLTALNKRQKPFPVSVLPQTFITELIKEEYNIAASAADGVLSNIAGARNDFLAKANPLLDLDTGMSGLVATVTSVTEKVKQTKRRKEALESFKRSYLKHVDYNKKPSIFCKPNKDDHIRFTSNAKIKRGKNGYYTIYGDDGNQLSVDRAELIYMGLAVIK